MNVDIDIGPLLLYKCVYDRSSDAATFGIIPMRRAEQRYFEDTVSDIIIRGFVKDFDSVTVELNESSGMVRVTRASDADSILIFAEDGNEG